MNDRPTSIKFCLTGRSGLGHFRRIGNIAAAVRQLSPEVSLRLVANAPIAGLAAAEIELFEEIRVTDRTSMAAALAAMPPGPVVVDTAVVPDLAALADPICLVLRETVAEKLAVFRPGLGRTWDTVVVPTPAGHWCADRAALGASRIEHVGWIFRERPAGAGVVLPAADGRARLLVATGGGGTAGTATALRREIEPILEGLRERLREIDILQVVGPRLPAEGRLSSADAFIDVGARLNEAFAEADAVVTTVGYNSVLEIAGLGTPALLVPIVRSLDDQLARATMWGPRVGRAHEAGRPDASVEWLAGVLAARIRRPPVDLGESGAEAAALEILSLVHATTGRQPWQFAKPQKPVRALTPDRIAVAASELFGHGVATPPARCRDGALVSVRVPGVTLRERLVAAGAAATRLPDIRHAARIIGPALEVVAAMHEAPIGLLALPRIEPLAKVRARLAATGGGGRPFDRLAVELADEIDHILAGRTAPTACIIHGDLHVGQVLFEEPAGRPWLLDLEDLAIGPAEFDIANLVAHFVTSDDLYCGPIAGGFQRLAGILGRAYVRSGGRALDVGLLAVLGAASLLRRAGKLRALERRSPSPAAVLAAAGELLAEGTEPTVPSPRSASLVPSFLEQT